MFLLKTNTCCFTVTISKNTFCLGVVDVATPGSFIQLVQCFLWLPKSKQSHWFKMKSIVCLIKPISITLSRQCYISAGGPVFVIIEPNASSSISENDASWLKKVFVVITIVKGSANNYCIFNLYPFLHMTPLKFQFQKFHHHYLSKALCQLQHHQTFVQLLTKH